VITERVARKVGDSKGNLDALITREKTCPVVDTTPLLSQIKVPTLILAPARSPIPPLPDQITMRTSIPNARMAVVEGPGHEI
jgi:pimeloyl-ACP methyl ester carboxylesterase